MGIVDYTTARRRAFAAEHGMFMRKPRSLRAELIGSWRLEYRYLLQQQMEEVIQIVALSHTGSVRAFREELHRNLQHLDNYRSLSLERILGLFQGGLTRYRQDWVGIESLPPAAVFTAIRREYQLSPGGAAILRRLMLTLTA